MFSDSLNCEAKSISESFSICHMPCLGMTMYGSQQQKNHNSINKKTIVKSLRMLTNC